MQQRIYSMELELSMQLYPPLEMNQTTFPSLNLPETGDMAPSLLLEQLKQKEPYLFCDRESPQRTFFRNGSCAYIDNVGCSPLLEWCLPECDTLATAIACDRTAMLILEDAAQRLRTLVQTQHPLHDFFLYKNNTALEKQKSTELAPNSLTHKVVTYGTHENYSLSCGELTYAMNANFSLVKQLAPTYFDPADEKQIPLLYVGVFMLPFLISRPILCGSGSLVQSPHNRIVQYELSQRAHFLEAGMNSKTVRERGIINLRNEKHAESYYRIHIICGDANMLDFSNYLKLGTTGIMLRMIEENHIFKHHLLIDNPVATLHEISADITCRKTYPVWRYGEKQHLSSIDIQQHYLDAARAFVQTYGSNPETDAVLYAWQYTLDALCNNHDRLFGKVDWITKKKVIQQYAEKENLILGHPKIQAINLFYHLLDHKKGLYYALEKKHPEWKLIPDDHVQRLRSEAPHTRAAARTKTADLLQQEGAIIGAMDWDKITVGQWAHTHCLLPDPFDPNIPKFSGEQQ